MFMSGAHIGPPGVMSVSLVGPLGVMSVSLVGPLGVMSGALVGPLGISIEPPRSPQSGNQTLIQSPLGPFDISSRSIWPLN